MKNLEKQVKLAQSFNDSIEYKLLKSKNKDISLLNNIKNERNKLNQKHLEVLKIKEEYELHDSKDYPSWIFCEQSVMEFYNFTYETLHNDILPLEKKDNRQNILENTSDKGEYYFKIKDRLINKSELIHYQKLKEELLEYLNNLFKDLFTENNYNTFKYCKSILDENKKNKKKIFIVKNSIQNLEDQTGINISKFFSVNWNLLELYIPIKKSQQRKNKGIDFEFDLHIDKISDYTNKIIDEDKYICQTINKITYKGISILTGEVNQQHLIYKQNSDESYQKKWSVLSNEQRIDRLKDYCNHFILNKIFIKSISTTLENLKEQNKINTSFVFESESILINKLYNLIHDKYINNILKYKHIKWNIKTGVVENIHNIYFEIDLQDDNNIILCPKFKEISPSITKNKISSSKSLFNLKSNIENTNDLLIKFIIDSIKNYKGDDYQQLKTNLINNCIEKVKNKLKVNKITNSDKEFIITQYNLFYDEIINEIR